METEPVVGDVRDPHSIPRRLCHPEGDERHRGADALLPEFRDHGHVDARDAGAEEEGGRGDRFSLPPPQVIPDERVGSETHAPEIIEQSADGGLRHFVSRREGGEPDPQRVFVTDRFDGELRWRRQMREQGIEINRHAAQFARMVESAILEVRPEISRLRGRTDPPHHRDPFREEVGQDGINRSLRVVLRDVSPEDPVQQLVREAGLHAQHVGTRVDLRPRHPCVGAVELAQVRFDRDDHVAGERCLDSADGLASLPRPAS